MTRFSGEGLTERTFFTAFWFITVAMVSSKMVVDDPDLWGHVLYGLAHISSGALPRVDTFSYTAYGAEWVNHEWLSELLFALGWKTAGAAGLWLIRFVLIGATLAIILHLVRRTTNGVWPGLLIYLACCYDISTGFEIRPQMFTYFFFSLLLLYLYRLYSRTDTNLWWALVPVPLLALWVNLHGGFIVGLGLLSWFAVCVAIDRHYGRRSTRFFYTTLAAASLAWLATLVNPYGPELYGWLWRSLSASRSGLITEWSTAFKYRPQLAVLGFYIVSALTLFLFLTSRLKKNLFEWGLLAVLCLIAWVNVRHSVFFCITAAVFLPRHVEALFPRLAAPRGFHPLFISSVLALCIFFAAGIHTIHGHRPTAIIVEARNHPFNSMRFIRENKLAGNIVVWFNWAQSALWYLNESSRVAFDGRFRTVYPKSVEEAYFHFHGMGDRWSNILDNYDTHMVLMPGSWPGVEELSMRKDWRVAYRSRTDGKVAGRNSRGEDSVLFIRRGSFADFERRLEQGAVRPLQERIVYRFGELL